MKRSEVLTGIQALRYHLEKGNGLTEADLNYYEEVLSEARRAVLLNEQNDPYAP